MSSHRVQKRLAILLAVAALVMAGCGGSGDNDDSGEGGNPTTTTLDEHAQEHAESGDHDMENMDHSEEPMDHDMEDMEHGDESSSGAGAEHHMEPAAKPAEPLALNADGTIDATKVDLGGVDGVSPEQQTRAEKLLKDTLAVLPKWSDYKTAEADGFVSIGDGLTGEEHFLHWDWINGDDHVLDPNYPESLVYKTGPNGSKTLEAPMFILPQSYNLENTPDIGGALTQFHIHDNLCFTADPAAPKVAGLTNGQGGCNPPLQKFNPNPMIHVWIRANECGPFAALLGVGAGQTLSGERACDHDHGRLSL
jgi:hypothetical protein